MQESHALEDELDLLDPARTRLYVDRFEDLVLEVGGEEVGRGLRVSRCFPVSAGERFIALRDHEGKEVGMVRDLSELEAESRRALEAELERAYFVPRIARVNAITEQYHVPTWDVETDRGPRLFELRSSRRDVRPLGKGRILIRDADGNRYEIADYRRLDPASRALVETQI